jgi:hypothetical protein
VKTCFAISKKVVVKIAPLHAFMNLTFFLGSNIYVIVIVKKTRIKGIKNLIINSVITPIFNPGRRGLKDLKSGIKDVPAKDTVKRAMIDVTIARETMIEKKIFLFCFTLKTMFKAFSRDAKT